MLRAGATTEGLPAQPSIDGHSCSERRRGTPASVPAPAPAPDLRR
jgi:hypothetical protein